LLVTVEKEADAGTPQVLPIRIQTMAETAIPVQDSSAAGIQAGETAAAVAAEIEKEGSLQRQAFLFLIKNVACQWLFFIIFQFSKVFEDNWRKSAVNVR
jgi:hypothetical protein